MNAPATLARLLQLSDSAFPTGAYAFSDGLETYAQDRRVHDHRTLLAFLRAQLQFGWGAQDAPACALAWKAAPDPDALAELNAHLSALKAVEGPRTASLRVGANLARALRALWPEQAASLPEHGHHAAVFGAAGRALGLPLDWTVTALTAGFVQARAVAATRLFPLGGTDAQRVIRDLEPDVARTARRALNAQLSELGGFSPALDLAAHAQATLSARLFQS